MRVERDIYYVLRYSFTFILAAMFTFITIFNTLTMVQSNGVPFVLYLSIANNIVGVFSLLPVYLVNFLQAERYEFILLRDGCALHDLPAYFSISALLRSAIIVF
jgi:hypothetical protein